MENSENENYQYNCFHKRRRLFIGTLLLTIGAFIIFNQLNPFAFHLPYYFFSWKMFLIALGVLFIIFRNRWWTGINLLIIGTVFLIPDIMGLNYADVWRFWPVVLILIGISMIFKPREQYWAHHHHHWDNEYWKNKHYWKYHHHPHHWNHRWEDNDQRWHGNEKRPDEDWSKK
jgi:predicted membrane protein